MILYIDQRDDLNSFNEIATDIIKNNTCVLNPDGLKLYESEIDIKSNCLVPFQKETSHSNTKDWMISDVSVLLFWVLSLTELKI